MNETVTHKPFDHEPARLWKHHGIWCALYEAPYFKGSYNGYVLVPKGHPFRNFEHYDEIPVHCHGGLTYGWQNLPPLEVPDPDTGETHTLPGRVRTGEDVNWWIGFDTLHAGDQETDWGLMTLHRNDPEAFFKANKSIYTIEDVARMTEELADQVALASIEGGK